MREQYDTSYGKFDSPFTHYVYENVILNGFGGDEFAGNADMGESVQRVGRRLIFEDSQGFVGMDTYPTDDAAEHAFALAADVYATDEEEK